MHHAIAVRDGVSEEGAAARRIEALVTRAADGDGRAFGSLVRHYDPGLRQLAFRLLGDAARMDDALQEAYVKAFRSLPRFRRQARFSTWLYRIVYNACLDELRRISRRAELPLEAVPPPAAAAGPDEPGDREALAQALRELAPEDRAAVVLVDVQGFDYGEAARVLDVPRGTVASRLNRARRRLRRALETEEEGQ